MSYLHCHSCGWSQDDFWSWNWSGLRKFWKWKRRPFGYNPLSLILEDFSEYWKPRMISFDAYAAKDMGFKNSNIFSWSMLFYNLAWHVQRIFRQRWWTFNQWKKYYDKGFAVCPKCKCSDKLDID